VNKLDQLNLSEFMKKKSDYDRTLELRQKINQLFKDEKLRNSLEIELKGGILWGKEVELGENVQAEKGAAILGKTKILKGKIEKSAIVIDCIIQEIEAKSKSMLFLVEQLDEEKVETEKEQFLTDLIILDKGIIRKVRVCSKIGEIIKNKIFNIDGREITFNKLLEFSNFKASYINGSSYQFREKLFGQPLNILFEKVGILKRYEGNPILKPIPENYWEAKSVYNPAAIRIDGTTYIVYRALGNDNISRLGFAWSRDGFNMDGKLNYPIFTPDAEYEFKETEILRNRIREKGGCEDPRLTLIGDRIYMTYSAYGEVLQIAMASIKIQDFIKIPNTPKSEIKKKWIKYGPLFSNVYDRNAVLFPERIDGKYVLLRRPIRGKIRNIAISFSETLEPPWKHNFVEIMKARPKMWDSERVGAGAQVLKSRYGWLLIYHGVGINKGRRSYMIGAALLDLNDPTKVIYRSPEPIFVPEKDYEFYGWAPNVVFTNGIVPKNKDSDQIINDTDELMMYYGGGDQVIGVASARLCDIVPLKEL